MLLFFLYTGVEVSLGAWAYTLLTESRGIAPAVAGWLTGSYWAFFTVGRFSAGLYTHKISTHTLIYGCITGALVGVALLWWNPISIVSLIGIGLVGLSIAPIFPGFMSGTSERVTPRFAANTIGMEMSAAGIGSAAIPALIGVLAKNTTLEAIPPALFSLFLLLMGIYVYSVFSGKRIQQATAGKLDSVESD
jgi:fucose permease